MEIIMHLELTEKNKMVGDYKNPSKSSVNMKCHRFAEVTYGTVPLRLFHLLLLPSSYFHSPGFYLATNSMLLRKISHIYLLVL